MRAMHGIGHQCLPRTDQRRAARRSDECAFFNSASTPPALEWRHAFSPIAVVSLAHSARRLTVLPTVQRVRRRHHGRREQPGVRHGGICAGLLVRSPVGGHRPRRSVPGPRSTRELSPTFHRSQDDERKDCCVWRPSDSAATGTVVHHTADSVRSERTFVTGFAFVDDRSRQTEEAIQTLLDAIDTDVEQ